MKCNIRRNRFSEFTDEELYILERQAVESSFSIVMEDKYSQNEIETHKRLINEIIQAIKERDAIL